MPDSVLDAWKVYSAGNDYAPQASYREEDIMSGLIVDITGDQFSDFDNPVYVGYMDAFHRDFEFVQAYEDHELPTQRLIALYDIIGEYFENLEQ